MGSLVDDLCDAKRNAIVALGRQLADQGAHYLWGANGEKPRPGGVVRLTTPVLSAKKVMFCAAIRGDCVCVGRFKARGFDGLLPAQKVWDPSFDSGRAAVDGFIDRVKANPGQQVGWGFDLTPRLISGYSDGKGIPTDYGGIGSLLGKVVWGEGCDDTQHFDCGGFVRYVAKQVTGVPIDRISKNQNLPNLV